MEASFQKLEVWRRAHEYVLQIYKLTAKFPKTETYALTDQLRRSASSVPTNIAEGNGRQSKKEYIQFLYNAKGSLEESRYQLLLARDLGYVPSETYEELALKASGISRMLSGLVKYLRS